MIIDPSDDPPPSDVIGMLLQTAGCLLVGASLAGMTCYVAAFFANWMSQ